VPITSHDVRNSIIASVLMGLAALAISMSLLIPAFFVATIEFGISSLAELESVLYWMWLPATVSGNLQFSILFGTGVCAVSFLVISVVNPFIPQHERF